MPKTTLHHLITLCKPRVVMLMVLTALIGMILPLGHTDVVVSTLTLCIAPIAIGLSACAGGAINQLIDQKVDAIMARTENRPLPTGEISTYTGIFFTLFLITASLILLITFTNPLCTVLTVSALIGYAGIYTLILKRLTPHNIVIGGLPGAMPPLLGWTAVTGSFSLDAWLLVMIIFTWTPPHFWALCIARIEDYRSANIPMLPVTHGIPYTKQHILLHTLMLMLITTLPLFTGLMHIPYLIAIIPLNSIFILKISRLFGNNNTPPAMDAFYYSIQYLSYLFIAILIDHFISLH
jgi:protoheme IX farnesyltransferase